MQVLAEGVVVVGCIPVIPNHGEYSQPKVHGDDRDSSLRSE